MFNILKKKILIYSNLYPCVYILYNHSLSEIWKHSCNYHSELIHLQE